MRIANHKNLVRGLALSLVLAAVGFCYATATAPSVDSRGFEQAGNAQPRIVGSSNLRFLNPLLADNAFPNPDDFEIGDACYGTVLTRYLSAAGGMRGFSFLATGVSASVIAANSSLALGASGCLMGSVAFGTPSPLIIEASVSDATGTTVQTLSGRFFLNLFVCGPNDFRFAMDRINNGVLGQNYIAKLETLGGNVPVVFSVVDGTLTVNGVARGISGLEAIGLTLAEDGTIFGRPLEVGAVQFTARAIDGLKRVAAPRTGAGQDQVITFNVEDTRITSTDYATLSCSVKGDTGKANKDTIKFAGLINIPGVSPNTTPLPFVRSLNGTAFTFRLAGATFEGRFNEKGQVVNQRGGPVIFADGARLKASVNSRSGQLRGSISKANLSRPLQAANITEGGTKRVGMGTVLCSAILGADMIEFATRRSGSKYRLDYKLGKIGRPLGGAFQLLSCKGTDRRTISGDEGDIWDAKFLIIPRFGIDANPGLDALAALGVRIGTRFDQRISSQALSSSKGGKVKLSVPKAKTLGAIVTKFSLDPVKFVGTLQTNPLSTFVTGLPQARNSRGITLSYFDIGIDLDRTGANADFIGEYGRKINSSAQPNKPGGGTKLNKGIWFDQSNLK